MHLKEETYAPKINKHVQKTHRTQSVVWQTLDSGIVHRNSQISHQMISPMCYTVPPLCYTVPHPSPVLHSPLFVLYDGRFFCCHIKLEPPSNLMLSILSLTEIKVISPISSSGECLVFPPFAIVTACPYLNSNIIYNDAIYEIVISE